MKTKILILAALMCAASIPGHAIDDRDLQPTADVGAQLAIGFAGAALGSMFYKDTTPIETKVAIEGLSGLALGFLYEQARSRGNVDPAKVFVSGLGAGLCLSWQFKFNY